MDRMDKRKLCGLIEKWRGVLGLSEHWSIGVKVNTKPSDAPEEFRDAFAYTEVEEAYFQADISFNEWRFASKDDEYLDLVACHEVLHIVMHKVEGLVEQALGDNEELATILNENTVEILSRALLKIQK